MFDEVICNYPLPEKPPAFIKPDHRFQTKSFDCYMDTYIISKDGKLSKKHNKYMYHEDEDNLDVTKLEDTDEDHTGEVFFYTSNIHGSGPAIYTSNGEDYESVTYKAIFINGKLSSIIESERDIGPAFPIAKMRIETLGDVKDEDTKERNRKRQEKIDESALGKKLYLLYGGTDKGHYATVVAETDTEMCLKDEETGKLKVEYKSFRNHIIWDTKEEAHAEREDSKSKWEKGRKEYEDLKKEWELKNPDKVKVTDTEDEVDTEPVKTAEIGDVND